MESGYCCRYGEVKYPLFVYLKKVKYYWTFERLISKRLERV